MCRHCEAGLHVHICQCGWTSLSLEDRRLCRRRFGHLQVLHGNEDVTRSKDMQVNDLAVRDQDGELEALTGTRLDKLIGV